MGQQPFIFGPEPPVLIGLRFHHRLFRVGPHGQGHHHPEALGFVQMAGRIVQRGGVDLHRHPRRDPEGLDLLRVQNAVLNLLLPCQQQNKVLCAQIELAVPVVFQTVQFRIMAIAPAQLHGHPAVAMLADLHHGREFLQGLVFRHIFHTGSLRGRLQHGQNFLDRVFQAFHDLTVGLEFRVVNRINFHTSSFASRANVVFSAG